MATGAMGRAREFLPRTTERSVRKRGDECSGLPTRVVSQSHGRKTVVRGLPTRNREDGAVGHGDDTGGDAAEKEL